jgi:hypothetical protein
LLAVGGNGPSLSRDGRHGDPAARAKPDRLDGPRNRIRSCERQAGRPDGTGDRPEPRPLRPRLRPRRPASRLPSRAAVAQHGGLGHGRDPDRLGQERQPGRRFSSPAASTATSTRAPSRSRASPAPSTAPQCRAGSSCCPPSTSGRHERHPPVASGRPRPQPLLPGRPPRHLLADAGALHRHR